MDRTQLLVMLLNLLLRYGPELIRIVHDIVHECEGHPDEAVRAHAARMHAALHGDKLVEPE